MMGYEVFIANKKNEILVDLKKLHIKNEGSVGWNPIS